MGKTILIVDDEKNITDILSFNLKKEGYDVICAYDGRTGLSMALENNPDLILLDIMLPRLSGFDVCREIRKENRTTPIIMLTAREEERDKVLGLDLGSDDYITKPFSMREVMARVKANIRRVGAIVDDQRPIPNGLVIDKEHLDVYKNGQSAQLTQREFELLCFLSEHSERVVSREELLREVWKYDFLGDLRAVDVAVRRLREKIESDPANPEYIITKRGVGYFFKNK